MKKEMDKQSCS